MPMLVQIDNSNGGINGMAPWGASFADIMYESPLHKNGNTRVSLLFSDEIPSAAGPVRSARIGHVWLREEWDAGFLYYGESKAKGVNVPDEFKKLKTSAKGVLFSGTVGENKEHKKFYTTWPGRVSPGNMSGDVLAMQGLIPAEHQPPIRPFLFTDELPSTGDFATRITLNWPHKDYISSFVYDEATNSYSRFVTDQPYVDSEVDEQLAFSNVIIQRVPLSFKGNAQPLTGNDKGAGNADIFIGGRYIPGYWVKTEVGERTIFFDADGNELMLQRGKTYIAMMSDDMEVVYGE